MRKRLWVVGGAALVVLVVVVIVVWPGRALEREVTAAPGQVMDVLSVGAVAAVFDDRATDTAYFAFLGSGVRRVAAIRAGSDEPLWNVAVDVSYAVELDVVGGVLLVIPDCSSACGSMRALDTATGEELWTTSLSVGDVIGDADGHVVMGTTASGYRNGAAGLNLATGQVVWQVTGERDQFAQVPGTNRLAHYIDDGKLRLLDIPTGRTEASIDVPPYRDGWSSELTASADEVALGFSGGTPKADDYTVYTATDLDERWSRDERVYPLPPDHYFASEGNNSRVLDERGEQVWTVDRQVHRTAEETNWVYTETHEGETYRTRYFDLATGEQLADDTNVIAYAAAQTVLQADRLSEGQGLHLWYLDLPSGDRTDLGDLDVHRETCAFSPTYIACLDAELTFGMWSY